MHIGIDCRLPYYQTGGISAYVVNLVSALAELDTGHKFTIFHSRKNGHSHISSLVSGFNRANLWTPCHNRNERWSLGVELLRHRLDLFHSPDFIPPAFGARRRVITVHDLNFLFFPEFLTAESRRYYNGQIEWAVQVADHIMVDSLHSRLDLIDRISVEPEKVTTVPLAAGSVFSQSHTSEAISETLSQAGLNPGYILFVGTLSPRKNVRMLLKAFELLIRESGMQVQLALAGAKGWLADDLFTAIAESPAKDSIVHQPGLTDVQMAHLYSAASMLAIPSFYEGFGLPVLEAMHCCCPVLASNRSSLPEVVGSAGILLDPEDHYAWAENMKRLLEDTGERDRLVQLGMQRAREFTWQKTAESAMMVYERYSK